jgi:hypothetical protein
VTIRRKRRIAADEAHSWARNLRLRNPYAKLVLTMLTLYVNGDGICFVSLAQLAEDCEFAAETVRRRLMWLESIGAVVRMPQWLDENGRRNSEGRGKRTTDEIRLMIDSDPEVIEAAANGGNSSASDPIEENSISQPDEISHSPTVVANSEGEKALAPPLATQQPPSCVRGLISEPEPESSPLPPSGGGVSSEDWREFEEDWQEPILRQSIAQQVWAALKPDERSLARQAARGYVAHRKAQRKPPNVIAAHTFLRERDAWPKFAAMAPEAAPSRNSTGIPTGSTEADAIRSLYAVARTRPFEHKHRVVYPRPVTPQLAAFAEAGSCAEWPWIEQGSAIRSWSDFLDLHVLGARPPLVVERLVDGQKRRGLFAPWLFPPSVEGKTYPITGPPEVLMTEADEVEFR